MYERVRVVNAVVFVGFVVFDLRTPSSAVWNLRVSPVDFLDLLLLLLLLLFSSLLLSESELDMDEISL